MLLRDFDFVLPETLIAQIPAEKRDQSRLMRLVRNQPVVAKHHTFHEIVSMLKEGDLLVLNNTRVIPARIKAKKETGGKVELLFVEKVSTQSGVRTLQSNEDMLHSDVSTISKWGEESWIVLAKASRPLKAGSTLYLDGGECVQVETRIEGGQYSVRLSQSLVQKGLIHYLDSVGELPLPPYIEPDPNSADHRNRYQTVYAKTPGAVAAPTAGLHFTESILQALKDKGVQIAWVTLHVGLGTFLPVRVDVVEEHTMHSEVYNVPQETVELWKSTKASGGRVISVGTTALRALESACQDGVLQAGDNSTSIFIYPGYTFKAIDGLLTNFHLPCSTLLMLVAAFHGHERILDAYKEAVQEEYRFFSYGDAMLIL